MYYPLKWLYPNWARFLKFCPPCIFLNQFVFVTCCLSNFYLLVLVLGSSSAAVLGLLTDKSG